MHRQCLDSNPSINFGCSTSPREVVSPAKECGADRFSSLLSSSLIKVANSEQELDRIWDARDEMFSTKYPVISSRDTDQYDLNACVLFSQNDQGVVTSTARIVLDSELGLPFMEHVPRNKLGSHLRSRHFAEPSKLAISPSAKGLLPLYMRSFYEIATGLNIESLIFICEAKKVGFYEKVVDGVVLIEDIGFGYGTNRCFSLLEWRLADSREKLSIWLKEVLS